MKTGRTLRQKSRKIPGVSLHPGFIVCTVTPKFMRKGMMYDGAEPKRVTIFIVKHYGVIYRLQGSGSRVL